MLIDSICNTKKYHDKGDEFTISFPPDTESIIVAQTHYIAECIFDIENNRFSYNNFNETFKTNYTTEHLRRLKTHVEKHINSNKRVNILYAKFKNLYGESKIPKKRVSWDKETIGTIKKLMANETKSVGTEKALAWLNQRFVNNKDNPIEAYVLNQALYRLDSPVQSNKNIHSTQNPPKPNDPLSALRKQVKPSQLPENPVNNAISTHSFSLPFEKA